MKNKFQTQWGYANMVPYHTINEAAKLTGLSTCYLRDGVKKGVIPHIKSGNTYLIDVPLLLISLRSQCVL